MSRIIYIALLIVGVALIVWGFTAADSLESDVARVFTGSPTDKSMWLMISGGAASVVGLLGLIFGGKLNQ